MTDAFQVSLGAHLLSGFVHHTPWIWKALARLETMTLGTRLTAVSVDRPVWVSGLARSGSTILLEILAAHPAVATHQYRDFPFTMIPHWWRSTLQNAGEQPSAATERAHGDRLLVTSASPEAMEETLWMAFFDRLHDPSRSHVLDQSARNPAFEAFFADHIRKLMLVTGRSRYVSKANYNVTRFDYLQKQFNDARFVVPVRDPRAHVASLRKQHRLFSEAAVKYPRSVAHLNRVGHFEFGPNRRPINAGGDVVASIDELWQAGEEVRGWARSWAHVYGYVHRAAPTMGGASLVLRYEDLCSHPAASLERLFAHTALEVGSNAVIDEFRDRLSAPEYYSADFTSAEEQAIVEECGEVAGELGYDLGTNKPTTDSAGPRVS